MSFSPGDKVRFRRMPGRGPGVVVRVADHGIDAYSGHAFRFEVELVGLDEGKPYKYVDTFLASDLASVSAKGGAS